MAEHAAPEYATAPGNDYTSHERTYQGFVHMAFIGILHVASVLIGLAIGGVTGHWLVAFGVFAVATVAAIQGFMSNTRTASYGALVLSLIALALSAG
ncbi:MAG TPA: aa3-type cytochrome c oxidase subunit IV [Xanthobacteraceae bacterium]|nr:aa3-type cytochrome c oxidase subunit IV [Xanthobacteraceae bacterium]